MDSKPTLFVVQGAYQTPEFYEEFEKKLLDSGWPVIHPVLPTCSNTDDADFPERTVSNDVVILQTQLQTLLNENKTVIALLHSYGGMLGSEAITAEMSISERTKNGLRGGVAHLIFFASVTLPEKLSVLGVNGGVCPPNSDNKVRGIQRLRQCSPD